MPLRCHYGRKLNGQSVFYSCWKNPRPLTYIRRSDLTQVHCQRSWTCPSTTAYKSPTSTFIPNELRWSGPFSKSSGLTSARLSIHPSLLPLGSKSCPCGNSLDGNTISGRQRIQRLEDGLIGVEAVVGASGGVYRQDEDVQAA